MRTVLTLLALGAIAFVVVAVLGLLASVFGLVCWMIFLPFRILGWVFRGFAWLMALPFLLLFGFIGVLIFGAGMLAFMVPVIPFALLAWGAWWLVNRRGPATAPRTQ
jgi:hypothetical protein